LLDIDEEMLFNLFKYPSERVKERMKKNFKSKAVAVNALRENPVTVEEAKNAFKKGFEIGLNISLEPYTLTAEEHAFVEKIAMEKYNTDDWNYKR
jgi:lipoate-protein ligase A